MHLGYESCPEHTPETIFSGDGGPRPEHFRLGARPEGFSGKEGAIDKSVFIVNDHVRLTGIPGEAHSYKVNGRTPLEWFIDHYRVSTDTRSGIVNDANAWFKHSEDLITAIRRIVHLSFKTVRFVESMPTAREMS